MTTSETLFKSLSRRCLQATACFTLAVLTACNGPDNKSKDKNSADTAAQATGRPANAGALTLPVLDALFYEPDFVASLKSQLQLTNAEIEKLKAAAHTSLADLTEDGVEPGSARTAAQSYQDKINEIIGADKAQQLLALVNDRYSKGVNGLAPTKPNFVPNDTRIVVNAPAYRMDLFRDGKLIKSYKVGIGYPEFPLPTGMRRADTLIFNPSWTPPDEPWVKGKFQPGKKVSGSDELNPLGLIKIPIGMPSLIHGGKPLTKIGNFASHGCVGLTNNQVQELTRLVAQLGGSTLSADSIQLFKKQGKTRSVNLPKAVPVDLRYETIVAEGGSLHIYRDVYERGTNTLENAKQILQTYGVDYNKLTEPEKAALNQALEEMNRDAKGKAIAEDLKPSKDGVPASKVERSQDGKITSRVKGETETVVPIAALQGKGYPAPVAMNSGGDGASAKM